MNTLVLIMLILFSAPLAGYLVGKIHRNLRILAALAGVTASLVLLFPLLGSEMTYKTVIAGFSIVWKITSLGWLFGMMILALSLLVMIFSISYMSDKKRVGYYCFSLCVTIAGMIGIVFSADLISFFFFWEIMTWSSFLLVIYYRFEAQTAGIKYFVFSAIGAYAMMIAIFIIYRQVGSVEFSAVTAAFGTLSLTTQIGIIALFFLAFGVKAGLVPLHVWAPDAYGISPAPFTALFSGGLSKMGVYGFFLMLHVFGAFKLSGEFYSVNGLPATDYTLAWFGALTALLATVAAVVQSDAKRLLAYSSIGQVGYIILGLALSSTLGVTSALFHTINHAIFKGALFLAVGAVFYRTGTRDLNKMGGLIRNMPYTFFVVLLGIIAVAGIPPLSGFVGKWMLYEALIQQKLVFLAIVTFAASTGSFLYLYRLIFSIFLGQRPERFDEIKEVPWLMRIPMLILALLTVYLGAYPYKLLDLIGYVEQSFMGIKPLAPGMTVLLGSWGGVNTLTAISVVGASFVSVLIILSFYKRSHKVGQLDIHTAGEIPKPEVNLHFAVNFFQPFSRGMAPLLKHSFGRFFDKIGENLEGLFDLLRYFYTGNGQTYALYVIVFLVFLLIFGGQVL